MKLEKFRVRNFRSIIDSGSVDISNLTALVGRNETGKTNLLLALTKLGRESLRSCYFVRDFPRASQTQEFASELPVLNTKWELSEADRQELQMFCPRASTVTHVEAALNFGGGLRMGFPGLSPLSKKERETLENFNQLKRSDDILRYYLEGLEKSVTGLRAESAGRINRDHIKQLRDYAEKTDFDLVDLALSDDKESYLCALVLCKLPSFVYLQDCPLVPGRQRMSELVERNGNNSLLHHAAFDSLMKVAGLNPLRLHELFDKGHQERRVLINSASAAVTKTLGDLWTNRETSIRFGLDGDYFDTLVSNPKEGLDAEVNLDEQSLGFRYFFSFFVRMAAATEGVRHLDNTILLLDEPGLHLHAVAQRDLVDFMAEGVENQIIYTTHSPFMLPRRGLGDVRTITRPSNMVGTEVQNASASDTKTMLPLLHALGVEISQSLFVSEWNLVVEGVTDHWYISSISDYLEELGKSHLPEWLAITPAGGSSKVPYMVTLLTGNHLKAIVLFDEEPAARNIAGNLVKIAKLAREESILFVSSGFSDEGVRAADIEDLLDPEVFKTLVETSYKKELHGNQLRLNESIPRIVKRYESGFSELGLEFRKARVARLFFSLMGTSPSSLFDDASIERFERLFQAIIHCSDVIRRRDRRHYQ